MTGAHNHITVNCPNLPVLSPSIKGEIPYGAFLNSATDDRSHIEPAVASVRSQDMYLPNFSIRQFEGCFKHTVVFKNLDADGAHLLGSCIFLEADISTYLAGNASGLAPKQSPDIRSSDRSQNFKYDPHNELLHKLAAESRIHYLHVSYDPAYFTRLLPENEAWADWLRNKISRRERILGERAKPLSLAQLRAVQNILDCPLGGKLGEMMLETSVTQILLFQLDYLFNGQGQNSAFVKGKKDMEVAFSLKEYLAQTYLEDHSITGLSKQFGVNSNQLMAIFKRQFGKSIFEYISERRMEYAMHLLQDKQLRVVEVARTLGYRNPNHFSTAFKRAFGVGPSEYKHGGSFEKDYAEAEYVVN